eukprot:9621691-Ditylum_brightwellii.AAC.1
MGHYSNEYTKQANEGDETGVSLLMAYLNTDDDSDKEFAFMQAHIGIPKTWLLLDSKPMVDMFSNAKMLVNIRTTDKWVTVYGNNGVPKTNTIGTLIGYGDVWLDRNKITNILSLLKAKHKFHVMYDSEKSDAFEVHKPDKILLFHEYKNNLHYHDTANRSVVKLNHKEIDPGKGIILLNNVIGMVNGNMNKFSKWQVEASSKARKLYGM